MAIELKVPEVGESVTEVQIGDWHFKEGDTIARDQTVVSIETDKVTVDVTAPAPGRLSRIILSKGATARVGDVVGMLEPIAEVSSAPSSTRVAPSSTEAKPSAKSDSSVAADSRLSATESKHSGSPPNPAAPVKPPQSPEAAPWASPSARRALAERGLRIEDVSAQSQQGRIVRQDVERLAATAGTVLESVAPSPVLAEGSGHDLDEELVPMSPFRQRIAARLVESQHQAALLTTFNEIDMSNVQQMRKDIQTSFQEKHGVKLGLMSFFVRAALEALKAIPVVNAEVRGTDIVYKNHYDIGIAVGGGRGLVVPVLRNVERMGFATIERTIADLGARAKANKIELQELQGGTFTISNGGVYGSMLSTPIVNPPQSAILGLHAINDRPVAREGQVVIRPMMYVALTYDHRIIDGREAVTFLRMVKEFVEQPVRMLFEI